MRRAWVVAAAAAGLSACHPVEISRSGGVSEVWTGSQPDVALVAPARLDCPDEEGDLRRVSEAADGRSCRYEMDQGGQVDLTLAPAPGGRAQSAVEPIRADLIRALPLPAAADEGAAAGPSKSEAGQGGPSGPPPPPGPGDNAMTSSADGGGDRDQADVDLPGIHIHAHGREAKLRIFGVNVNANGDDAQVDTHIGSRAATVRAGDWGAVVTADRIGRHAVDLVYVRASRDPGADGIRSAGYIARGPVGGPLVVATFRSRASRDHVGKADIQRLVDLNLHPA